MNDKTILINGKEVDIDAEELYLSYIQVEDVSSLARLVNIKHLGLTNTKITDISSIANLVNLEILDLENTNIVNSFR